MVRAIVVVDVRTCKKARRQIDALLVQGDYVRAKGGITAARLWLRYEVRTASRRRRRVWCASQLETLELVEEGVNQMVGLTSGPEDPRMGRA